MKILEINNVSKTYAAKGRNKGLPVKAVSNVTLDVEEGEILGLLGANGAGKTTLIKLILGLAVMDAGSIKIAGFDAINNREKALQGVGALVEAPTLFVEMSGWENLKYYAKLQGGNITDEKIKAIVELVGLTDRINSKFKTYSLGMKQRLGIAQAIMHSPSLLLLDEPTNGLDPSGIAQMRELFVRLKQELGITIIISSHILSEMQQVCDRVAFMAKGEIKAVKTMEEVNFGVDNLRKFSIECSDPEAVKELISSQGFECEISGKAIIVVADQEAVSAIISTLVNNSIDVYAVNKIKRTLEDLYKEVSK
ncbi:MAG: ABC transporter ATP-binding protein [Clostridia bacterium]|nr:ABC transporter ATP-binding protein [Clostridia bacterium]MDE7328951.1 ABC transporter ATP-binding protein [Clostridia bacterium]